MSSSGDHREPLEELAEEYLGRLREGERPSLEEYVERSPDLADQIRDLFPTLAMVESLAPAPGIEGNAAQMSVGGELQRVGEYRIIREIGRGGMGVVYEAEQESLGRRVALKVLKSHGPMSSQHEERFQLEARAAAHLHHTNIVPVFAVGEEAGLHYYAMQYIRGQGLDEVMKEVKQLREEGAGSHSDPSPSGVATLAMMSRPADPDHYVSLDSDALSEVGASQLTQAYSPAAAKPKAAPTQSDALSDTTTKGSKSDAYYHSVARVGLQVAEALAYSHREGILHRDIKPSNLLIDTNGEAWVTDFGLAKINDVKDLTQTGDVVGTLRYLAPERLSGQSDARSDVYSLGLTLYELVALTPAYHGLDKQALIANIAKRNPMPLHRRDPRAPRDLQTVIEKSIARTPSDRYQNADELGQDLRRFLEYRPVLARRVSLNERLRRWCRRNPAVAVCLGLIGVLLTAVAAISAVYAVRLQSSLALQTDAELKALRQLATARLSEGSARRRSGRIGQRVESSKVLSKASQWANRLSQRGDDLKEFRAKLRNEWIAALALTDVELQSQWKGALRIYDPERIRYGTVSSVGVLEVYEGDGQKHSFEAERLPSNTVMHWSPDGRWLAVYLTASRVYRFVDTQTMEWLPGATAEGTRRSLAFSPDSQRVACGFKGESILLYQFGDLGSPVRSIPTPAAVSSIAWAHDNRMAYCHAHRSGVATVIHLKDPKYRLNFLHGGGVDSVAFHPTDDRLATSCRTGEVSLWNLSTRQLVLVFGEHKVEATKVAFSQNGRLLVSTGWDGITQLWDARSGARLLPLHGVFVGFSGDDQSIDLTLKGIGGARYRLVESNTFRARMLEMDSKGPWNVAFSHDSQWMATSCVNQGVAVWPVGGGRMTMLPTGWTQNVEFDGQGGLICASEGFGVARWPQRMRASGDYTFGPPETMDRKAAKMVEVSRDGRLLATSHHSGEIRIRREGEVYELTHAGVSNLSLSPDGKYLSSATWRGKDAIVWSTETGEEIYRYACGSATAIFSPCGRRLAMTSSQGCCIVQTDSWHTLRLWQWDETLAWGTTCFSPDGEIVVLKGEGSRINLCHIESGEIVAELSPPSDEYILNSFAISPDYSTLAATSANHKLLEWDLAAIHAELKERGLEWRLANVQPKRKLGDISLRGERGDREADGPLSATRRFLAAGHLLDRMREESPELGPSALMLQAKAAMKAEETTDALSALKSLIQLRSTSPRVHLLMAEVLMWSRSDKAVDSVTRALELAHAAKAAGRVHDMEFVFILRKSVAILLGAGKVSDAISTAKALLNHTPRSAEAHDCLARAFLGAPSRHVEDAVSEARIAVNRDPRCRSYRLTLARALQHQGEVKEATECIGSSGSDDLRANPVDEPLEHLALASLAQLAGRSREAVERYGAAFAWRKKHRGISAEMMLMRRELWRVRRLIQTK